MASYAQLVLDPEGARTENEEEPVLSEPAAVARSVRRPAVAVLGASLLLVAGVVALGTSKGSGVLQGSMSSLISEEAACAGHGQDCRDSKCCQHEGNRCFKKNDHWAACNATCDANMIWDHDSQEWKFSSTTVWNCQDLTTCKGGVDHGADCRETKCCKDPGSKCFKKNDHWASCNATCDNNKVWNASTGKWDHTPSHLWDCTVLTPCAGGVSDGEDCRDTKCCKAPGSQCFKKNDHWASCNATCDNNKVWNADTGKWDHTPSHLWDCTVLTPGGDAGGKDDAGDGGSATGTDAGDEGSTGTGDDEAGGDAGGEDAGATDDSGDAGDETSEDAGGEDDAGDEGSTSAGDDKAAGDEESGGEDDAGDEGSTGTGDDKAGGDAGGEDATDTAGDEESEDAAEE